MSDKTEDELLPCPFCGNIAYVSASRKLNAWGYYVACVRCAAKTDYYVTEEASIKAWNTRKPMERYEELESKLQSVYGECDGLLETVVDGLVKHEGVEFEKPMRARLLTDEDVDKWDKLKGAMERIVERLEDNSTWTDPTYDMDGYSNEDEIEVINLQKAIQIVKEEM